MPLINNCVVTLTNKNTGTALATNVSGNLFSADGTAAMPFILSGQRGDLDLTNTYTLLLDTLDTMPKVGDNVTITSSTNFGTAMVGTTWVIYKAPAQQPALLGIAATTQLELARART